jgi:hypothetical protein
LLRASTGDDAVGTLPARTITGYKYSYLTSHSLRFLELIVSNFVNPRLAVDLGALP